MSAYLSDAVLLPVDLDVFIPGRTTSRFQYQKGYDVLRYKGLVSYPLNSFFHVFTSTSLPASVIIDVSTGYHSANADVVPYSSTTPRWDRHDRLDLVVLGNPKSTGQWQLVASGSNLDLAAGSTIRWVSTGLGVAGE
eukprot:2864301-Rhodomonas_salina.1